jgi:cellulose biosynthesis protein BcsQ
VVVDDSRAPGVIVVAEQCVHDLLIAQPVGWRVQERVDSIATMWDALSSGALDPYSRVVVFSDSLHDGEPTESDELAQTAWATAAMAGAGARVFVAVWRPERAEALDRQIVEAATAQGLDAQRLEYHALPVVESARAVLDTLREKLWHDIEFPADWNGHVDVALRRRAEPAGLPLRPPMRSPGLPVMPPSPQHREPGQQWNEPPAEKHWNEPPAEKQWNEPPAEKQWNEPPAEKQWNEPQREPERAFVREVIVDEGWLRPGLPPITGPVPTGESWSDEYPAQAVQELLERPPILGQATLAVTSSKGGSGKTTVSIMLAASIARASADAGRALSVIVVDLDTYHGQVSSVVGTFMPTALNIRVHDSWDEATIRANIVADASLGIDVLLAPVRPRTADVVGPSFYRTIVRSLKRMYDVIVIDTGNQYLDPLVADVALAEADVVLFVTTLASTSVHGMARALRELTASPDDAGLGVRRESIGIVVNQAAAGVGSDGDALVAAGLGIPVVGVIPLATRDVLRATNASRMADLLDHDLLGPAYTDLARACLPNRVLAGWREPQTVGAPMGGHDVLSEADPDGSAERRGLFRR